MIFARPLSQQLIHTHLMKKLSLISLLLASASASIALNASDNASNYIAVPGWTDGSNGGTGFLNWSLNNNNGTGGAAAGVFIGDSIAGAGDINSLGNSFGMFANSDGGAFSTATRSFSTALTTGDQFSFQMALNFDNGNKGFSLRTAGNSIFGFNVGSGGGVGSNNAIITPGTGAGYDYGGGDALLDAVILVTAPTSLNYQISRTSSSGFQGVLFSGTVTGIVGAIDNFEFYVSGTDNGDPQNNLYFNNLAVVPEPSAYGLFFGVLALLWVTRRR
jgi:hypothetical protein